MLVTERCDRIKTTDLVFGPWSVCSHAPGAISHPDQLCTSNSDWIETCVPGTVAAALRDAGRWDMNQPPDIDSLDWWYRTTFAGQQTERCLCWFDIEGLATLAQVWLNGECLLQTDNMFRTFRLDLFSKLESANELVIGFRSIAHSLQRKRPVLDGKTNLINHQQLRWLRTSLVGRIPGWSPPVPVIGPWRSLKIQQSTIELVDKSLRTQLDGNDGLVQFDARLNSINPVIHAALRVGADEFALNLGEGPVGLKCFGDISLPDVPKWWPHTHGEPHLLPCQLVVETESEQFCFDCGKIGFRSLRVSQTDGFSIEINGTSIHCRGGCWTTSDVFLLNGTEESLRHDLTLVRDAGANMLRVIGTMTYESDLFYQLCDELGLLVWQDFMFANMDYPVDDTTFRDSIEAEAVCQLRRLSSHPSVIAYCGNSEIEQQAAMLGMPVSFGAMIGSPLICQSYAQNFIPERRICRPRQRAEVPPFHTNSGVSHYYGVGAYRRPITELRQASVRFTPECLGFANVPEPAMIEQIMDGANPAIHHPAWKRRVPRDTGAGWDFEDVRDHYLKQIYGVDPTELRSSDTTRYLELSRVISGEMMHQTFSEWRSVHSRNQGGLVWFWKDLWPAAGWGITGSSGDPKAAYYFLKRTWKPIQIVVTDEGLNGLHLHTINESSRPFAGSIEITLLKEPNVVIARHQTAVNVDPRGKTFVSADQVLGGFYDVNYSYRFAPFNTTSWLRHCSMNHKRLSASHSILSADGKRTCRQLSWKPRFKQTSNPRSA